MQSRSRATIGALLFALVVLSLATRVSILLERPLWHDELFTAWAARLDPRALVDALRLDSGPPLFYLLERPFARAAGPAGDRGVRILPFLAALAFLPAARTLPRGAARSWWIALVACFALGNLYAAEARAYCLLSLLCLGLFLLGLRGEQTRPRLLGLTAVAAAALWIHYLALVAVAAALLLALGRRRLRSAAALSAGLLLFAPWIPILLAQPPGAMAWLREPPERSLAGFLSALGGVGRIPAPFGPAPPPAILAGSVLAGAALLVLGLAATRDDPEARSGLAFVAVVLALALGASLWRPIAFAGRSEMAVIGVWMWVVARAAARRRSVSMAAALAAALGLVATLFVVFGPHPRPTSSSAVASLARLARPGDVVLAGPGFYLPARVASDRGILSARIESLPPGDASHPGWFIAAPLSRGELAGVFRIAGEMAPGARLFLLLPPSHSTPTLMRPLEERGTLRELVRQDDGVLTVWTPPRPGP